MGQMIGFAILISVIYWIYSNIKEKNLKTMDQNEYWQKAIQQAYQDGFRDGAKHRGNSL